MYTRLQHTLLLLLSNINSSENEKQRLPEPSNSYEIVSTHLSPYHLSVDATETPKQHLCGQQRYESVALGFVHPYSINIDYFLLAAIEVLQQSLVLFRRAVTPNMHKHTYIRYTLFSKHVNYLVVQNMSTDLTS